MLDSNAIKTTFAMRTYPDGYNYDEKPLLACFSKAFLLKKCYIKMF
jgi:hypothetical protein